MRGAQRRDGPPELAIVGAGRVGSALALVSLLRGLVRSDQVVLYDTCPGKAQAVAADLGVAARTAFGHPGLPGWAPMGFPWSYLRGASDEAILHNAKVVVVCAGYSPSPGFPGPDLEAANRAVGRSLGEILAREAPGTTVLVSTSPSLAVAAELLDASGFPRERVIATGPVLDEQRVRSWLAHRLEVHPAAVELFALGGECEALSFDLDRATVDGQPLLGLMERSEIQSAVYESLVMQAELSLAGGSASFSAALGLYTMLDYMRRPEGWRSCCGFMAQGEFGVSGGFVAMPARVDMSGLREILAPSPWDEGVRAIEASAAANRPSSAK